MAMNKIQFQAGLSLPDCLAPSGTEAHCEASLEQSCWPHGFCCPGCGHTEHYVLKSGGRKTFQCRSCRLQTSLIAGTLFQGTHLKLTVWFLAIYLISQAKTGLSALALKRQWSVSYPTAWLIQQKLMHAMVERDTQYTLSGHIQVDDAYLGGELTGGKAGRGSENKVPYVAALSLSDEGHPRFVKMTPIAGFTRQAIANWSQNELSPGSVVVSDGLACSAGVTDVNCQHQVIIAGGRKPKDLPEFSWINTVLGNLKTNLGGAYHAFDFAKYGTRYLGAFAYRLNRRFQLDTITTGLILAAATTTGPRSDYWLRQAEASC